MTSSAAGVPEAGAKITEDPAEIEEDAFLAGPDRHAEWQETGDGDLLDVDWIFGKDIAQVLKDIEEYDPSGLDPVADAPETRSLRAAGYRFRNIEAGVLLLAPDGGIAGGYLGCDLAVAPEHRNQGLGAELVLERYLRDGDLPTWHLDAAAYSPDGEAAHRAAWRLLQDPQFLARKRADLEPAQPESTKTS